MLSIPGIYYPELFLYTEGKNPWLETGTKVVWYISMKKQMLYKQLVGVYLFELVFPGY